MIARTKQRLNLLNILRFVASEPSRLRILAKKVKKRILGESVHGSPENDAWISAHSIDAEKIATKLDPELWVEAMTFGAEFREHAARALDDIPHDLGGGSHHTFLYWLTRYIRPQVVVETGVAAGWSSRAFLMGIRKNGRGTLYSSDLPYFRLPNPENFIGVLVEDELRSNWNLQIDSDEINLPRILSEVSGVDIFHYDSDKMASGRDFAVKLVRDKITTDGVIVMDDISNDDWFRNYVTKEQVPYCVIDERYGLIGNIAFESRR
jgi:hypothetical protein